MRIGLLVAPFMTSDFFLVLREVLWKAVKVSVERVLAAQDRPTRQAFGHLSRGAVKSRAVAHLLGCYQLGMDAAVSWLDSHQVESMVMLAGNK